MHYLTRIEGYVLAYIEFEQAREAAVIDHFLEVRAEKQ